MKIKLPYGGDGLFSIEELVSYVDSLRRPHIIIGGQNTTYDKHTKHTSLDYWLRQFASPAYKDTRQAVHDVIQEIIDSGKFKLVRARCPDSGRQCKALRVTQ